MSSINKYLDFSNVSIVESTVYPGYYQIPNFTRYYINPTTLKLLSTSEKYGTKILDWQTTYNGYRYLSLYKDDGRRITIRRHHLLAAMFLKDTVDNIFAYSVEYKNSVVGDDSLDNLTLVPVQQATITSHTSRIVQVRQIDDGDVRTYASIGACTKDLAMDRDTLLRRLAVGPSRVFPERLQYRLCDTEESTHAPWPEISDIDKAIHSTTRDTAVIIHDCFTSIDTTYPTCKKACEILKIGESTLSTYLSNNESQGVHYAPKSDIVFQCKYAYDKRPWKRILDLMEELKASNDHFKPVIVEDTISHKRYVYPTIERCAVERNIHPNTLSSRLKSKGDKVYSDGCKYMFYEDFTDKTRDKSLIYWNDSVTTH